MGIIFLMKGLFGGGIFSSLFVAVDKKGLAHLLLNNYGVQEVEVCEKLKEEGSIEPSHSNSGISRRNSGA